MAEIVEHTRDCRKLFKDKKKGYRKVHLFLDQYAQIFPIGYFNDYHRTFLHNSYGLEVIHSMWGEEAYIAGLIHLYRDYMEAPITTLSLDTIIQRSGKAIIYFNSDLDQLELRLDPSVTASWQGESLVSLATKKGDK